MTKTGQKFKQAKNDFWKQSSLPAQSALTAQNGKTAVFWPKGQKPTPEKRLKIDILPILRQNALKLKVDFEEIDLFKI